MVNPSTNNLDFSPLSWPDDYLMSRAQAEMLSRALGLPIAEQYLAKLHCVSSDGPPTVHFGRKARLRVGPFKQWLTDRMSPPRRSTSETAYPISDSIVVVDSTAGVRSSRLRLPSPQTTKGIATRAASAKRTHKPPERNSPGSDRSGAMVSSSADEGLPAPLASD